MRKTTLKELIEIEFERCETISQFKKEVFRLIDTYIDDSSQLSDRKITITADQINKNFLNNSGI